MKKLFKKLSRQVALKMIQVYQMWSHTRPPRCRFLPTCSQYCAEAIEQHGTAKGGFYGLRRLLKCHPLGPWGYDPVPAKPTELKSS